MNKVIENTTNLRVNLDSGGFLKNINKIVTIQKKHRKLQPVNNA